MTHPNKDLQTSHDPFHSESSLKSYLIGFVLSILLTLSAYFLVEQRLLPKHELMIAILLLGLIQTYVQLHYFLHLGEQEKGMRWKHLAFLFMILVSFIIVGGTMWIMYDLDSRVMNMNMNTHHELKEGSV